ncbi:MAG: hypothetical protein HOP17_04480 [Acidobacteria bacterium]|nr:hypothetical protein [Acidobacteriota bacterium]
MDNLKLSRIKLLGAAATLLLVLVVVFAGTPNTSMAKLTPETPGKLRLDGASDYAAQCARCHGGDGRGQTAKGRKTNAGDLTKSTVSDTKGIRMITNGSGQMPAFKDSMNADQIRGVMSYVHGFRR